MCVMSLPARPVVSSPWALKGSVLLLSVSADFRTSLCVTGLVSLHGAHLRSWREHRFLAPRQAGPVKVTLAFQQTSQCVVVGGQGEAWPKLQGCFLFCFFVFIHLAHGGCQPARPLRHLCLTFSSPVRSGEPTPLGLCFMNAAGTQSKASLKRHST